MVAGIAIKAVRCNSRRPASEPIYNALSPTSAGCALRSPAKRTPPPVRALARRVDCRRGGVIQAVASRGKSAGPNCPDHANVPSLPLIQRIDVGANQIDIHFRPTRLGAFPPRKKRFPFGNRIRLERVAYLPGTDGSNRFPSGESRAKFEQRTAFGRGRYAGHAFSLGVYLTQEHDPLFRKRADGCR